MSPANKSQYLLWGKALLLNALLGLVFNSIAFAAPMVITYRAPESDKDKRYDYDTALLRLALDKTVAEYGAYKLVPSPVMNYARAIALVEYNVLPNFFIKLSYDAKLPAQLDYVAFPVDLGIVGYRVCFISPKGKEQLALAANFDDVKMLVHGQGRGWGDVEILRHNGFIVKEVSNYESFFSMVAINRFDLFCRGANELFDEYELFKEINGLSYDSTIAFSYPLPRFFYTNKANALALERVMKGLKLAYNDGSLKRLWLEKYQNSIEFSQLDKRKIYYLDNPLIQGLDFDFKQYFYRPNVLSPEYENK